MRYKGLHISRTTDGSSLRAPLVRGVANDLEKSLLSLVERLAAELIWQN